MKYDFYKVGHQDEGQRLDHFLTLKKVLPTRSQVQRLIEEERVRVNAFSTKPGYIIKNLDTIYVEIPAPQESVLHAEAISVNIVYEDDDIVVVNKSAGMVVHPGAGNKEGTLVHALLHHCKNLSGIGGVLRPGIVHRLDKDTSGLIVVAKNDEAHLNLSQQFKKRTIRRTYKALVFGRFEKPHGSFNAPIGRHPIQRKKMTTKSKRGKPALTIWEVIESFDQMSLIKAKLETGRTHQIRVHFSDAGNPVVGDGTYGGKSRAKNIINAKLKQEIESLKSLLLHAEKLTFIHPRTQELLSFEVPLPDSFQHILGILHE